MFNQPTIIYQIEEGVLMNVCRDPQCSWHRRGWL